MWCGKRGGREYVPFYLKPSSLPCLSKFIAERHLSTLSLIIVLLIIISSLTALAEGAASSNSINLGKLVAEYRFSGIAVVVRGYSSGSPEPIFVRLPVVYGRIVTHFPTSFVKFKVVLICGNTTSKPIIKGNLAIMRTRCTLKLPLILDFNASVKAYMLDNGSIKAYLHLNMTYVRFLVKAESSRIGVVGGHIIIYSSGRGLTFPPNTATPLRIEFPANLLLGVKLLYVFTESPSAYGAVVKVNGTYAGNILPFYVLWPSNVSEYMSYKRMHAVMVFAGTGFKLKFNSLLNRVIAYVPYGISHIYQAVLTPLSASLSASGMVRNSSLSMLVPSVSGVPITRMMAVANSSSVGLRYLKTIRKALQSGEYSYNNISVKYAVFPKNNANISLPLIDVAQLRDVGFYYTLHYPIAFVSLPLPLHGKASKILGGDAIILYGYANNRYIIPTEQKIEELSSKIVSMPSSRHAIPPYIIPALVLGVTAVALSAIYISRRRRR